MDPVSRWQDRLTRRTFLGNSTAGLGTAVLASLLNSTLSAADRVSVDRWPGVVRPRNVAAKAKRIIHLCMAGGPSHLETFDDKPKLAEMHGKPMPESYTRGKPIACGAENAFV